MCTIVTIANTTVINAILLQEGLAVASIAQ